MATVAKRCGFVDQLVEVAVALVAAAIMMAGATGLKRAIEAFPAAASPGVVEASPARAPGPLALPPALD